MKYEKYTSEGMSEDQATEKVNMKTQWAIKRNFFARFKNFLASYLHLKDDETYQDIVWDLTFVNCGHLKNFLLLPDLKIW